MVNLKAIQMRVKSVGSIQKITKSMKMVSTSKYGKAEKLLRIVRPFGVGTKVVYNYFGLEKEDHDEKNKLLYAISSDKGLCGAIHSSVTKRVMKEMRNESKLEDTRLVCVGEKSRLIMQYSAPVSLTLSVSGMGRKLPTFTDASEIVQKTKDIDFNRGKIVFNKFNSILSYTTTTIPIYSYAAVTSSPKLNVYNYSLAELYSFMEFSHASLVYYSLVENSVSELSARMAAMENATKNAGEIIADLKLEYNRKRQSAITQELIEIISGASALKTEI